MGKFKSLHPLTLAKKCFRLKWEKKKEPTDDPMKHLKKLGWDW